MKEKIGVILASVREGRKGEIVAKWFMNATKDNPNAAIELLDLKEFNLPRFQEPALPATREGKDSNPVVQKWLDKVAEMDAFVIVTPEYNYSVSSTLKDALDFPYKEWNNKPVAFVSYGGIAGGARVVAHLRAVVAELQMFDIRESILIPFVGAAFDEAGNLKNNNEAAVKTANAIIDKLATLAGKLKAD